MSDVDATPGAGSGYCGARDPAAIEARITDLIGQLDVEQTVGLMHGAGLAPTDGVWLVPGNERLGIPGLRMLDGPRGVSAVTGLRATAFPVAMMRGATWDPGLEEEVGRAMAGELLSVGGNVLLAPTINILRHPRWGRAQETYSEDVHHMGEMAVAFIRGVQGLGVLASAKHFAANTIEDTRFEVDVQLDERTLREIYLPHFQRAVTEAHVASVMSAYNSVNGLHADQQVHLLSLPDAVESGEVEVERIDGAVRRILRAQLCFGLDERPIVRDDPTRRETAEHLALAREVARRGMVLLRNEGGVLPLAADVGSIVVAGRNADAENIGDTGSSSVTPSEVVTALEGLIERAGKSATVTHVPGTALDPDQEAIVQAADVVVVVTGLQASDEGEGVVGAGDRADLAVPAEEVAFIQSLAALNPALVVVIEGGSAFVTSDWDAEAAALVHAFYPGAQGGRALADVLFGDVAPSGRLPFSMPEAEVDLPVFDNVSSTVTYDYFHGYRHLLREETPARFPFGFGLSYTSFAYSDLALDKDRVTGEETAIARVTVTNMGAVAATETVQLYVTALGSRVERSPADLRGFAQVSLDPGESRAVEIPVRVADLASYDVDSEAWEVEPISYQVRVAANAADPGLVAELQVE
jgi:beta-glucosidase